MGRGRLKSGLQAFGAGRLRRIPSVTIEQIIVDPPPPGGSTNPDISQGGGILTPAGGTIDIFGSGGGAPGATVVNVPPSKGHDIGNGGLIIIVSPGGDIGDVQPNRDDVVDAGGGLPGQPRSLPASLPTRSVEIRDFPAPKTVVDNPSLTRTKGTIEFVGGITTTSPLIRLDPEFDPGARNQERNSYIKENLLAFTIHASDVIGVTNPNGLTYENNVLKYKELLFDLFALNPDGTSSQSSRDTTPLGLSLAGFPIRSRTLDNLADGGLAHGSGTSGGNFFSQQFFRYDLTGNNGVTGMTTGDTITDASLFLTVDSHIVDRNSAPGYMGDTTSFVEGAASVPPRIFEAIKVNATYDADFGKYLSGNSWGATYGWSSFYGTSGTDVDSTKTVEFTISKPLKKGDKIKLDVKTLAADALSGASGIMRFAIRPKANSYGITGISSGSPTSNNGFGLHIFSIDREMERPEMILKFNPSNSSSKERLARLIRGK